MLSISREVINAIGYQIHPRESTMDRYEREHFVQILNAVQDREIKIIVEQQKLEKLKILTDTFNSIKEIGPLRDFYHNKIKNLLEE